LDPDTWTLEPDGKVIEENLVEKDKRWVRSEGGGCHEETLQEVVSESCLSQEQLVELSQMAQKIEGLYRFPQDVEWAYKDGQLWLLQSRPITTGVVSHQGRLFVWDNSNIVES